MWRPLSSQVTCFALFAGVRFLSKPRRLLDVLTAMTAIAFLHPSAMRFLDMGQIQIDPACIGPTRGELGEALRKSVFAHCLAGEAGRAADRQEALAGAVTPTHIFIGRQPAGPTSGARSGLGIAAAVGPKALSRLSAITG